MKTQCDRVLAYIKEHGSITTAQAMMDCGVYRLSARIYDLRREGHDIVKETVTAKNRFGESVSFASYRLRG